MLWQGSALCNNECTTMKHQIILIIAPSAISLTFVKPTANPILTVPFRLAQLNLSYTLCEFTSSEAMCVVYLPEPHKVHDTLSWGIVYTIFIQIETFVSLGPILLWANPTHERNRWFLRGEKPSKTQLATQSAIRLRNNIRQICDCCKIGLGGGLSLCANKFSVPFFQNGQNRICSSGPENS